MLKPGFQLNLHNRAENVLFESHDPGMMYDPVSGYCYSYSTDAAITSPYRQGIPVRRSKNLIDFEFVGYALSEQAIAEGRDNGEFPPTGGFWAPYTEYVRGEYRMYYSATKAFGSSESRIWLAVAKHPEGPFENRGVVVDTWGTTDKEPNAIDAHVVDTEDGKKYLIYGSFFGGIYIKELDKATGLSLDGNCHSLGKRIAHKPEDSYVDGPEGAAVLRVGGKYYLFLSYGWLGEDYDIRVGVSDCVEGPYLDREGKCLNGESLGQKLAGSYCFESKKPYAKTAVDKTKEKYSDAAWQFGGFYGPGHGVPFYYEPSDSYFFIHHVRDGAACLCREPKRPGEKRSYRMHYMMVRRMYFADGWPVFSPEPYAGEEKASALRLKDGALTGEWEWVEFSNANNEMVHSIKKENSDFLQCGVIGEAFDFENSCKCIIATGYTKDGNTVWAKRRKEEE